MSEIFSFLLQDPSRTKGSSLLSHLIVELIFKIFYCSFNSQRGRIQPACAIKDQFEMFPDQRPPAKANKATYGLARLGNHH